MIKKIIYIHLINIYTNFGGYYGKTSKDLTKQEHLEMYELMHLIRDFDMELSKLYSRGLVHGMTHYSVGEEAANVGAIYPLRKEDLMFSNHRGHVKQLLKELKLIA